MPHATPEEPMNLIDPGSASSSVVGGLAARVRALKDHPNYNQVLAELQGDGLSGMALTKALLADPRLNASKTADL